MTETSTPATVREAMPRLANGLIAYGVVGLVLALIAALALAWAGGRFASLGDRIETQAATIADTLDASASALQDASSSATSFAVTLERTPPIVRQVATALGDVETSLQSISSQLAAIDILGRQPLAGTAERVNNMAAALDGLDTRLGLVAGDLEGNRDALLANSASLARARRATHEPRRAASKRRACDRPRGYPGRARRVRPDPVDVDRPSIGRRAGARMVAPAAAHRVGIGRAQRRSRRSADRAAR